MPAKKIYHTEEAKLKAQKQSAKRYMASGKPKINSKRFYEKHKDDPGFKEKQKEYTDKWKSKLTSDDEVRIKEKAKKKKILRDRKEPRKALLWDARKRAKRDGLKFDININDFTIPQTCPVLGIPLFKVGGKKTNNSPSLDRIDNKKGYVKGNVQVISLRANVLKNNGDIEEFEQIIKYMKSNGVVRKK